MSVTGYAYPWDYLADPAAPARAVEIGVDVVALAATYHATRVVSPLHPTRRVTEIPASSSYVPIRDEVWRGHRLRPNPPTWLDGGDWFNGAQRRLSDVGLAVDAWIVLTHVDGVGADHPDLVVRNAFGESYPYALCPSSDDVREYCLTLVEETLSTTTCRGVVLEACGPMGFTHASTHDKTDYATLTVVSEQLLSICFCTTCHAELRAVGVDTVELAKRVRNGVEEGTDSVEEALGEDLAEMVARYREGLSTSLRRAVVERIRTVQTGATITAHVGASRWATGSFSSAGASDALSGLTAAVANCWDLGPADAELRDLAARLSHSIALGAYVRADRGWPNSGLIGDVIGRYVDFGASELHLYHLGLLSRSGLATAHDLASTFGDHVRKGEHETNSKSDEA